MDKILLKHVNIIEFITHFMQYIHKRHNTSNNNDKKKWQKSCAPFRLTQNEMEMNFAHIFNSIETRTFISRWIIISIIFLLHLIWFNFYSFRLIFKAN